jgi:hypothetical protein
MRQVPSPSVVILMRVVTHDSRRRVATFKHQFDALEHRLRILGASPVAFTVSILDFAFLTVAHQFDVTMPDRDRHRRSHYAAGVDWGRP